MRVQIWPTAHLQPLSERSDAVAQETVEDVAIVTEVGAIGGSSNGLKEVLHQGVPLHPDYLCHRWRTLAQVDEGDEERGGSNHGPLLR